MRDDNCKKKRVAQQKIRYWESPSTKIKSIEILWMNTKQK